MSYDNEVEDTLRERICVLETALRTHLEVHLKVEKDELVIAGKEALEGQMNWIESEAADRVSVELRKLGEVSNQEAINGSNISNAYLVDGVPYMITAKISIERLGVEG